MKKTIHKQGRQQQRRGCMYPREGLLTGPLVQEGQPAPACYEVLWSLTVLIVHGIHHLSLQHRVAPHQAPPQLALLCNACYILCPVPI